MDQEMPMTEDEIEPVEPVVELTAEQRLAMIAELADIEPETETPKMGDAPEDEMKIGAMISRSNAAKIQSAHDALTQLGAACQGVKITEPDELVTFGGEIKAFGGGKVGGYLVRFSDENTPDLIGDYFTKDTNFGEANEAAPWFHHRLPLVIDGKVAYPAIKRKFGSTVSLVKDEIGVFASAVLDLRDKYENFVHEQIKAGKIGWSSGTNTAERVHGTNGKASWLKTWLLGEDASYTPSPAEFRNSVTAIKSLLPASGVADAVQTKTVVKDIEMDALEIKAIVDAALAEQAAAVKATADKAAELKAAQDAGYKLAVDELKGKIKSTHYVKAAVTDDNDGIGAFKAWLKTGQKNDSLIEPDQNLLGIKAAFNQTTGATGGYLVPDPLYNQIIAKRNIASWVRQAPTQKFSTSSDHLLIPVEDTSHTAFVATNEAAAYDENEGTVAQVDLALIKYTKLVKASEEFMLDENSNFDGWLSEALARAEAVTENTVATTAILASATAGTAAAAQAALTIPEIYRLIGTLGGGYFVNGQVGFLMKNATYWYLRGVEATNYQPAQILAGQPAFISDDMPAMATSLRSTLFGNFNYFAVLERPGMLVQRNPYLYMANGQIGIFANIYRGFAVLQAEAFYTMAQA